MRTTSVAIPEKEFAERLLAWFASAMRPLPWRGTYDPYGVWISEIMLQQTQMERGVRCFNAWMRRFPDIRSVAEADEEEILAAWEGLGYYSRARNLHAAARRIMDEHGGEFPRALESIRALPGVGEYTAGAIAAIAFNIPEPAVDANVMRIFARLGDIDAPLAGKGVRASIAGTVAALIPEDSPRLFCQALMELGALVCGRTPKCGECPLSGHCLSHRRGTTGERPVKSGKTRRSPHEAAAAVIVRDGLVFIQKRPRRGLWAGLWEFPGGRVRPGERPDLAAARHAGEQAGLRVAVREKIAVERHSYTTHSVTLHCYLCECECEAGAGAGAPAAVSGREGAWVAPEEIARYAFSAGQRKVLERIGWKRGVPRRRGSE